MTKVRTSPARSRAVGHTLIELMIAILVGMFLIGGAFSVMAAFEGHKRSTTAVNDALQSGNYGLYTIDKLIRSSGSGLARYAASAGWGCGLNYTPILPDGSASGSVVTSTSTPSLPAPFNGTGLTTLRLAPAVIFPGATTVEGSPNGSDVLMVMLGGSGYGEAPIPITDKNGPLVASTVGFGVGEWVLVGSGAIGNCMITHVDASYTGSAVNNVVLPLTDSTIGAAVGLIDVNNLVVSLGYGQAASFMMFGVGPVASTTQAHTLWSLDLLNSQLLGTSPQAVSDDIVMMRAVYQVQPKDPSGNLLALKWVSPQSGINIGGYSFDYSPSGLLAGTTTASDTLKSIRAIRVALIVRAPLQEKNAANDQAVSATNAVNAGTYTMFSNMTGVSVAWTVPASGQNYRYREIETSIPVRNGLLN